MNEATPREVTMNDTRVLRCGWPYKVVTVNAVNYTNPVIVVATNPKTGKDKLALLTKYGKQFRTIDGDFDLIDPPKFVELYATMYEDRIGGTYASLEWAMKCKQPGCLAIARITLNPATLEMKIEEAWRKEQP